MMSHKHYFKELIKMKNEYFIIYISELYNIFKNFHYIQILDIHIIKVFILHFIYIYEDLYKKKIYHYYCYYYYFKFSFNCFNFSNSQL